MAAPTVLAGLLVVLLPVCLCQNACSPDKLSDANTLAVCLSTLKTAATAASPTFVPSSTVLQFYLDVKFSNEAFKLYDVCCQDFVIPSSNIRLNPLDNIKYPNYAMMNPPDIDFWTAGGFEINDDHMYTYGLFDISGGANIGTPQRPVLHWLVTNAKGFKTIEYGGEGKGGGRRKRHVMEGWGNYGDTVQSYNVPGGYHTYMFLWFNQTQTSKIKINIYDYVENCKYPYSKICYFDLQKLITDKGLVVMGTSWVTGENNGYMGYVLHEKYKLSEQEACLTTFPNLVSNMYTNNGINVSFTPEGDVICAGTRLQVWQTYCILAFVFMFNLLRN